MEISLDNITQNKHVKILQRKAKVVTTGKEEMYVALESVQEFFNRTSLRQFNTDTPYAKDMCEKMKALGLDIN